MQNLLHLCCENLSKNYNYILDNSFYRDFFHICQTTFNQYIKKFAQLIIEKTNKHYFSVLEFKAHTNYEENVY